MTENSARGSHNQPYVRLVLVACLVWVGMPIATMAFSVIPSSLVALSSDEVDMAWMYFRVTITHSLPVDQVLPPEVERWSTVLSPEMKRADLDYFRPRYDALRFRSFCWLVVTGSIASCMNVFLATRDALGSARKWSYIGCVLIVLSLSNVALVYVFRSELATLLATSMSVD